MKSITQLVSDAGNFHSELVAIKAANAQFTGAQARLGVANAALVEWTELFQSSVESGDFAAADEADAERHKAEAQIQAIKAEIQAIKAAKIPYNNKALASCEADLKGALNRLNRATEGATKRVAGLNRVLVAIDRKIAGKERSLERAGLKQRRTIASEIAELNRDRADIARQLEEVKAELSTHSIAEGERRAQQPRKRKVVKTEPMTYSPFAALGQVING